MNSCSACGKKGLLLKVNSCGMCKDCETEARNKKIAEARAFHDFLADKASIIPTSTYKFQLKHLEKEEIFEKLSACKFVIENIPKWDQYECFTQVFLENCVQDSHNNFSKHKVFNTGLIFDSANVNMANLIDKYISDLKHVETALILTVPIGKTDPFICNVAGVTFKNEKRSRQTILGQIYHEKPPYIGDIDIHLEKYEFEDEPAVGVYTNDEQLGNISRDDLDYVLSRWDDYREVSAFDVIGGGKSYESEKLNYGLQIRIEFSSH